MKIVLLALWVLIVFSMMTGCGTGGSGGAEGGGAPKAQGVHYQGRDCLLCHNVDLGPNRYLTVAGTVFKTNTPNVDRLDDACGGNLRILFLDSNQSIVFDSGNYEDINSKGNNGKGDIFILQRMLTGLRGIYSLKILSGSGVLLAQSALPHRFQTEFDPQHPADPNNTYSCDACHSVQPLGGAAGPIFVQPGSETNCQ